MFQGVTILVTVPFWESRFLSRLEGARVGHTKPRESTEPLDRFVLPVIWRDPMWSPVALATSLRKPQVAGSIPVAGSIDLEQATCGGFEGGMSPSWGSYKGAGPLCRNR